MLTQAASNAQTKQMAPPKTMNFLNFIITGF
jgi:hypothetical protein